ncbi:hypothetical protein LL01C4_21660 [Escherichia coli]
MPLTVRQIESAKPADKDYKLSDGQGLYLLIKKSGARYWNLKYRFAGKEIGDWCLSRYITGSGASETG